MGQTANPMNQSANTVNIIWRAVAGTGDNTYTSTLTVAPNLNTSFTGSGSTGFPIPPGTPFGSTDFRTYNLNLINDYAPYCKYILPQRRSLPSFIIQTRLDC